jgi:hypothetical protein
VAFAIEQRAKRMRAAFAIDIDECECKSKKAFWFWRLGFFGELVKSHSQVAGRRSSRPLLGLGLAGNKLIRCFEPAPAPLFELAPPKLKS